MARNFPKELENAITMIPRDEARKLSVEQLSKKVFANMKQGSKLSPVDTEDFRLWAIGNYFMVLNRDRLKPCKPCKVGTPDKPCKPGWEDPYTHFEAHLCCDQIKLE